tara:strand:+ start:8160 stop:8429 length:270 start_codon:yes stop_codon:yes gene_type:complete
VAATHTVHVLLQRAQTVHLMVQLLTTAQAAPSTKPHVLVVQPVAALANHAHAPTAHFQVQVPTARQAARRHNLVAVTYLGVVQFQTVQV